MKVTIGIKALNEERSIAASLASALAALTACDGEVVLADSGSTDRTIDIARSFPIRIVQLKNLAERCCGAGAQLAFQHAQGEYFYLLDGDMVIDPKFLEAGIRYLDEHPEVAAVGGAVTEKNTQGQDFQIRANERRGGKGWAPGEVDRLDCGGLYRVSAIREVGYFSDRNLHAFEEFDLGARLRTAGWTLARIDHPAVEHFGHVMDGYHLLWRRVRSGYAGAPGEVLRAALGRPQFWAVIHGLNHLRNVFVVFVWWCLLVATTFFSFYGFVTLLLVPLLFLIVRRGSFSLGLYSLVSWNASAVALIQGLLRRRVSPLTPLESVDLTIVDKSGSGSVTLPDERRTLERR